jgi:hypothetical protein
MRISGITLPENKRLEIALTAVYGVGRPRAATIIKKLGLEMGMKTQSLLLIRRTLSVAKSNFSRQKEISSVKFSRTSSVSRISRHTEVSVTSSTFLLVDNEQKLTAELFVVTFVVLWEVDAVRQRRPKN